MADNSKSNAKTRVHFFKMMVAVGCELDKHTQALSNIGRNNQRPVVLDLCMAPGGFSAAVLKVNPTASLHGITLPSELGGHELLLAHKDLNVLSMDITLLAAEMGIKPEDVPKDHPDAGMFVFTRPFPDIKADLVFCDGQVLRPHAEHRADYRQNTEATRLDSAQLVLGLNRIKPGGTMIILCHRLEAWHTTNLIYKFSRFSNIRVHKAKTSHQVKSSFYLIATKVQPESEEARRAVERWKRAWRRTTFWGSELAEEEDGKDPTIVDGGDRVEDVLEAFGGRLIELGRPVWRLQANAIQNSWWFKKQK